jgi:hypothetical protein
MPVMEWMSKLGFRFWYDEGIDPGTEWDDHIAAHVEDCDCMLAFLSKNYVNSDNCKDELNYARDLQKERILIYLEPTVLPRGMAMRLNRIQAIHRYQYTDLNHFYDKLLEAPMLIRNRSSIHNTGGTISPQTSEKKERIEYDNGYYEGDVVNGKRHGKGVKGLVQCFLKGSSQHRFRQ